jgi:hypothetical protein
MQRQRRKHWWHKVSNLMVVLLVLVLAVISLRLSADPTIVFLGDKSGRVFLRNTDVYTQAARKLFADSPANGNKVTVDASRISRQLHTQFPELEVVSVSLPILGHRPVVYIQPATPKLLLTTTQGSAFVVDHSGQALIDAAQAPKALSGLDIPTVVDQSGVLLRAGHVALDSDSVAFITEVSGQLKSKGVAVASMTLPAGGSELDIAIAGAPYFAKFNMRGVAREEAGTFLAVKQQLDTQGKHPSQYVDVRVSGRAYYK